MNGIALCTFCGEQPELRLDDGWSQIRCVCDARGPMICDEEVSRRQNELAAMAAWNILVGAPSLPRRMKMKNPIKSA